MLSIGDVPVISPLILAPMAGITDLPFRLINRSFGCGLAFTEMMSARSLVQGNKNTSKMLETTPEDRPLGFQILGNDPEVIKKALDRISGLPFDIINLNAACPVKKVVSRGEGAGLLKDPERLRKLLQAMVSNVTVPVTVKIRSGWNDPSINAADVAHLAEDAGAKGIIIHGRTRMQGYAGKVDYSVIKNVKESVEITVIASGNALTPELIKKLFDETGCDGVAVARGALGNPWIFREAGSHLRGEMPPSRPGVHEVVQTMRNHLALNIQCHGERNGVMLFRKFFSWYTGEMNSKELKDKALRALTREEMLGLMDAVELREPGH